MTQIAKSAPRGKRPKSHRGGMRPGAGRPSKDAVDQQIVDVAAALMVVFKTGPQGARDLAIAWLEGEETDPPADLTSHSRRFRKAAGELHSFALPTNKTIRLSESPANRFEHRAETIRRKGLKPRLKVVQAYVAVFDALAAKDMLALTARLSAPVSAACSQRPPPAEKKVTNVYSALIFPGTLPTRN